MMERGSEEVRHQKRLSQATIGELEAVVAEREGTIQSLLARLEQLEQPLGAAWSRFYEETRRANNDLARRRAEADRAWSAAEARQAETEGLKDALQESRTLMDNQLHAAEVLREEIAALKARRSVRYADRLHGLAGRAAKRPDGG